MGSNVNVELEECPCSCIPKTETPFTVHSQTSYSDLMIDGSEEQIVASSTGSLITFIDSIDDSRYKKSVDEVEISDTEIVNASLDYEFNTNKMDKVSEAIIIDDSQQLITESKTPGKATTTQKSEALIPEEKSTKQSLPSEVSVPEEPVPIKTLPKFYENIITIKHVVEIHMASGKYLGTVRDNKFQLTDDEDESKSEEAWELYSEASISEDEDLEQHEEEQLDQLADGCENYLHFVNNAHNFLDKTFKSAEDACISKYDITVPELPRKPREKNIVWPTIEQFTRELGIKKVKEYIKFTFDLRENWIYNINFVAAQSDLSSDFYLFEVNMSLPAPSYPVAQATVSIYFRYEVSRIKPPNCPVTVTFTIESVNEIMIPGKIIINDRILLRVANSKLSVFSSVNF
ncbi:hypothetical protein NQ314_006168 [Rhamnusium bicolor]|uniref:Uncharacterized protein n=1 Tax=Rhamnusium bicolor TaxID=1586634 RepID=A0AAV8Z677_9CUCU|nr:hypothetical protein NQ314_006168 [Rhamnusium bicolor]